MTEIKLPDYWTPEQAKEVFEFIDEIREAILSRYQLQIMEQIQSERCCTEAEAINAVERRDTSF